MISCDVQLEMMKAVSFMYVKPPGYNAESAKAAEIADEKKKKYDDKNLQEQSVDGTTSSMYSRFYLLCLFYTS